MQSSWLPRVALACAVVVLPAGEVWADETPSWERVPPMITPRGGHAAMLLQDGRVLVAGGHGSDRTVLLREVELYDPASKTWAPAAPLRSPLREVAATAVLPDGLALLTDGENVEVYSPDLDQWSAAAPLTPALTAPQAVHLPGGKLMMLGSASRNLAGSIYDDLAGTWTPIRPLSGVSVSTATLLLDGRVLAVGSRFAASSRHGNIYDPETDSWTQAFQPKHWSPTYRATRLASGDVLFVGGFGFWGQGPSQLYLHEVDRWMVIDGHDPFYDPFPECLPVGGFDSGLGASLLPSGRVLLTGGMTLYDCGYEDENGQFVILSHFSEFSAALDVYDPATAAWGPLDVEPPERMARAHHTATSLHDGSVLIAGGLVKAASAADAPVPTASALLFHERAPLGAACEAGGDCASGFCADSVCCDAACAGPCDACAASAGATRDGACTPLSGTPCDDTDACLEGGVCEAGTCAGGTAAPDGTPCNDGEVCSATSTCEGGACVAASPASCQPPDGCHEPPACDPALGCSGPAPEKPDGARCDLAGTPDAWQAAATMPNEMKSALTATLLEDGTVLVLARENSTPARLGAMRYDPSVDGWQLLGWSLQVRPSSPLHATLLQDGTVLVTSSDRVDRFNPATDEWEGAAPMLQSHILGTATLLQDGRVLVTGGSAGSSEVYDPAADVWTLVAPMNAQRSHHTATLLQDGRVLVAGGGDSLASAEVYDPAADVWTPVASMSSARSSHTATLLEDGRVLVVGGSSYGSDLATVELYDPASDTWTPAAGMAARRYVTETVLLADGRVLLAGNLGGPYSLDHTAELYDPARDIWSLGPAMSIPIDGYVPARLNDGRVLIVGGELGHSTYPSHLVYLYVPGQRPGTGVCQAGVCLPSAGGEGGAGGSGGGEGGAGGSGGDASGTGVSSGDASGTGGSSGDASGTGGSSGDASGSGGSGGDASGTGVSSGDASGTGGSGGDASGTGVSSGDASGTGGSSGDASGTGGSSGDASGTGGSSGDASGTGGGGGDASGTGVSSGDASGTGGGGDASGTGGSGGDASGTGGGGGDASTAGGGGSTSTSAGSSSGTGDGGSAGDTGAQSGSGGGPPGRDSGGCQMEPGIQGTPTWLVLIGGLAALRVRRRSGAGARDR
ncbi:kelch repeat-containing protein [Sorangium sp. So ce406]|uniref:kelch repeat-containing protein n=1 Tax=Sorangium sp. So ce406 TaxID=3133311 RepID=UPI003F5B09BF